MGLIAVGPEGGGAGVAELLFTDGEVVVVFFAGVGFEFGEGFDFLCF